MTGQKDLAYANLHQAVLLGGNSALEQIQREQIYQQVANDPDFQKALQATQPQAIDATPKASDTGIPDSLQLQPTLMPTGWKNLKAQ